MQQHLIPVERVQVQQKTQGSHLERRGSKGGGEPEDPNFLALSRDEHVRVKGIPATTAVDFIEYYLFDCGVEDELPVVVWSGFGCQTVDSLWVNITGLPLVQVDFSLAALALVIYRSPCSPTRPFSVGSVTSTKKFIPYLRKLFAKVISSPSPH